MKTEKSKQQQVVEDNMAIVIKSLGINEQKYLNLQYETSVCWLLRKLDIKDARLLNKIACLPLFTKWWINQWNIREAGYVRTCNLKEIDEAMRGELRMVISEFFYDTHDSLGLKIRMNVWVQKEVYDFIKLEIEVNERVLNDLIDRIK